MYPIWNKKESKVEWYEDRVKPDSKLNIYFDNP